MFITLIVISCLGGVCNNPGNNFDKVSINTSLIEDVHDMRYYWIKDGKVEDNGHFTPNKNATLMSGCYINIKDRQRPFYVEFPCDDYVRPKLK